MKRNLTGKGQEKTVAEWHQAKRSTMSRWKTVCIVVVHIWAKDSTLATARRGGIEQRRGESRWECMVAFGWLRQEESRRVRRPSRRGRGLDGWSAKPVDAFKAFSRGAGKFRCPILVSVFTFRALLSRFCQRLRREKKIKGRRRRFSTGTRRRRHLVHKRGGFHGIPVGLPWLHPNDPTLSASYPNHFGRSRGPVGDNKENSISQSIQPQDREQRFWAAVSSTVEQVVDLICRK